MEKRGQVTVFIIISIIIIASIATFIMLDGDENNRPVSGASPLEQEVRSKVRDCMSKSMEEGIRVLGSRGGYYEIPEGEAERFYVSLQTATYPGENASLNQRTIPYYIKNGKNHIPSISLVEKELEKYLEENLPGCTNEIKNSINKSIETGDIETNVRLGNKSYLEIDHSVTIQSRNKTTRIDSFKKEVGFNFREKFDIVNEIIKEQEKDISIIPQTRFSQIAYRNNFTIETSSFAGGPLIEYNLIFNEKINNSDYIHSFVVEYSWEE